MIPGEIKTEQGERQLNAGRMQLKVTVANSGDRPIQIGSHYHFYEANPALKFDRTLCKGYRLDITSGTAVRFEPGEAQEVRVVDVGGKRRIVGFRGMINGPLDQGS